MKYVSFAFLFLFFALFIACEDDSLTSTETEYTYVTDTIIVNVVDTLQNTVVETRTDTIVLENDRHVVEYDTIAIDQECTQKDVNGAVTISCGSKDVTVNKATCDTTGFDPAKNFCYDGKIMDFCDGYAYNPEKYFCQNDSLIEKCKGEIYDAEKFFCVSNTLYELYKGNQYNTSWYFHQNDSLIRLCGGKRYDIDKEFCDHESIFTKCGGVAYKTMDKFCYNGSLVYLCNGKTYDLEKEFCYYGRIFNLCEGKEYHALDYFCYKGYLVNYCNENEFDPSKQFCYNDSLINQRDCSTFLQNNGCGYFADERDSLMYKYVVIGEQTWMAQNLNYAYNIPTSTLDSSSFCYDCSEKGRLYIWSAAMDSAAVFSEDGKGCGHRAVCEPKSENIRGICPKGWHLSKSTEWETLILNIGGHQNDGEKLRSKLWNGVDTYGFSVIHSSFIYTQMQYWTEWEESCFWYADQDSLITAKYKSFYPRGDSHETMSGKGTGRSIRCIKD